ncbi:MAG TPA: cobalt-precorrin-6A reductase [Acetobacteraceae bacterium]|jgi:precorrin-6A/cobalt-precorrin-6A reductase|nr:cobalt-precorrin-6A reductase [Acetobacteraceae bacterium]
MPALRILLLGGTSEASALARLLAGDARFAPTLSLAGRTRTPALPPIAHRIGGFGGPEGLADYLRVTDTDAIIDATHPFATRISANAAIAAQKTGVPLVRLTRPPWEPQQGDIWIPVDDMSRAAIALGPMPQRVLLTVGRQELAPFRAAPQHHYLIRSVDAPGMTELPARADVITARGPFAEADEIALMRERRIEVLVTKNSGAAATAAKLSAARRLGIPVVMIERPPEPVCGRTIIVHTPESARAWLARGV